MPVPFVSPETAKRTTLVSPETPKRTTLVSPETPKALSGVHCMETTLEPHNGPRTAAAPLPG